MTAREALEALAKDLEQEAQNAQSLRNRTADISACLRYADRAMTYRKAAGMARERAAAAKEVRCSDVGSALR